MSPLLAVGGSGITGASDTGGQHLVPHTPEAAIPAAAQETDSLMRHHGILRTEPLRGITDEEREALLAPGLYLEQEA